jgi:hypothetical protein
MEEEVRQILRRPVLEDQNPSVKLGSRIAARFTGAGLAEPLPALRSESTGPMNFGS